MDKGNLYNGMTLDRGTGHFHFFKKFKIPEIENLEKDDQKRTVGIFSTVLKQTNVKKPIEMHFYDKDDKTENFNFQKK